MPLLVGFAVGLKVPMDQFAALIVNDIQARVIGTSITSSDNPSEPCRTGVPGHDKPALRAVTKLDDTLE
ncbi:hypothetical protein HUW46_04500 [Amycolatopsis sp. CA-230715]|nr:hypothetical protein HUW46_04500 [Amycolatopsis sp. CA-230715]